MKVVATVLYLRPVSLQTMSEDPGNMRSDKPAQGLPDLVRPTGTMRLAPKHDERLRAMSNVFLTFVGETSATSCSQRFSATVDTRPR